MTVTVKRLDQLPQTEITSAIRKPDANEQIVLPLACTGAMTFHLYSSSKPLPKVRIPSPNPTRCRQQWQGLADVSLMHSNHLPAGHVQWKKKPHREINL